jgi:flagellar hook-length control protein FliK
MPLSDAVQDERFADLPVSSLQEDGSEDAALVKLAGLPGGGTAQEGDGKVLSDEEIVPMVSAAEPEVALHDADSSLAMKPDAANLATGVQSEAPSDSVVRMDAEVSGGLSEERVASADEAVRAAEPRVASERSEMAAAHATAVKEAVPGQAQQGQTQQGQTQPGQTQQGQTQQGQTQQGQTQQGQAQQGQTQQGQTQQGQTQQGQTQPGQTQQGQTQQGQTQQGQAQQGQTQQGQAQQGQAQQGQAQQGQTQHAQPSQPTQGQAVQQQFLQMAQASAQQVQMTRQSSPEARGATAVSAEALNASNVSVEEMLSSALGADKRASLPQGLQSIGLPMTHPRWGQALGQRVVYMTNNQVQQAQITLNPDKLGPVQIKLHVDKDQQVHVVVTAQQGATREALENAMPRLKEMMQEAGVDLGSVNVGDQRESTNQSQDKDGESHNRTSSASLEGVLTDTTDPSEGVTVGVSDTLVDYYA